MSIRVETQLRQPWILGAVGIIAALVVLASIMVFTSGPEGSRPAAGSASRSATDTSAVGQSLPTSFGVVAAESVQVIDEDSAESVESSPDNVQLQVFATITNLSGHEVAYSPDQFRLLVGDSGESVKPARSSIQAGVLQPQANIDDDIDFVVPRDASQLSLEFADLGDARPVLIDLGHVDLVPVGDPRSPPSR